jgi:hypothetical protein
MREKAARAKAAWLAMLATHRRSWPEWAELERRVCARDFVTHSIGPHAFLFSDAAGEEPPLSRQIASRGAPVREVAPPFPGWIGAIVGLGCQDAGNLASAGVLAHLWPPEKVRPLPEGWDVDRQLAPLNGPIPDPLFELQCNRSGTPLYSDGTSVLGFAEETSTLEKVGDLQVFSRFCLRYSLIGEDWVVAWRRGDGDAEGIRRLRYF